MLSKINWVKVWEVAKIIIPILLSAFVGHEAGKRSGANAAAVVLSAGK